MSLATIPDSKSGYHHGELPEALMALALKHIQAVGTEKLSLRALAREAGVSPTAPYRHFPTKQCLLAAIATQGFERLRQRTRNVVNSDAGLDERFINMGLAYIDFALENPVTYQLMFGSILADFSKYEMLKNASSSCYAEVEKMLQQVIDAHDSQLDIVLVGGIVWASVHGMASLLINADERSAVEVETSPMRSVAALRADKADALRFLFASLLGGDG